MMRTITSTAVDTVILDDLSARLHARAVELEHALSRALHSSYTSASLQRCFLRTAQCAHQVKDLAAKAGEGSRQYAQRELYLRGVSEEITSTLLWNLGRAMPTLVAAYGPAIIGGVAIVLGLAAARRIAPGSAYDAFLTQFEKRLPDSGQVFSSPLLVTATAHLVSGTDDFMAGVVGLPKPSRDGVFSGEDAVATGMIAGLGLVGARTLQETPVRVREVSQFTAPAPQGYQDVISRIPRAEDGAEQIRIERYDSGYVVYLGGTIDAGVEPGAEPWDMTSNMHSIAELDSGSYRAAVMAMKEAGISASDNVILVGHSQGGLIAAQLAASGEYRVSDVVTVGAPLHHIEIPEDVHVLSVEHSEDVIPSLSGVAAPVAVATHHTVKRSLYSGTSAPKDQVLPAHNLSRYIETGAVMDRSADSKLVSQHHRLSHHMRGTATVTTFRGDRVQ